MRVLVACEYSGIVREAFRKRGHDAWSCDLLPTDIPGHHIQGNIVNILTDGEEHIWEMMIAHPPCSHLSSSGAAWFESKRKDGRQQRAIDFFLFLASVDIPKIAIENPIGIMSTHYRKPDQIIQPYQFGEPVKKSTCLWLKNLPLLKPTKIVEPEITTLKTGAKFSTWDYKISMNHKERAKLRSKTFQGIADAMAEQWGLQTY